MSKVAIFDNLANKHMQRQAVNPFSNGKTVGNMAKPYIPKEEYGRYPQKSALTIFLFNANFLLQARERLPFGKQRIHRHTARLQRNAGTLRNHQRVRRKVIWASRKTGRSQKSYKFRTTIQCKCFFALEKKTDCVDQWWFIFSTK